MAVPVTLVWRNNPTFSLQWRGPESDTIDALALGATVTLAAVIGPGGGTADTTPYDDTVTAFGVDNVQDAIVALYTYIVGSVIANPWDLDFSDDNDTAYVVTVL